MDVVRPPDARFELAAAAFRDGRYFEAHERWEEIWRELPPGYERRFTHGLIHAAVALYQHGRGNSYGARRQYERALRKLHGAYRGFEADRLLEELEAILRGGPSV